MSFPYRDFIINMKNPNSYVESISGYEAIFTKYFADLGFTWEAYVDASDYRNYTHAPFAYEAAELINFDGRFFRTDIGMKAILGRENL